MLVLVVFEQGVDVGGAVCTRNFARCVAFQFHGMGRIPYEGVWIPISCGLGDCGGVGVGAGCGVWVCGAGDVGARCVVQVTVVAVLELVLAVVFG